MDGFGIDLDISGFSPEKKKVLQDFIKLFDKVQKYDKMKISPVLGGGLTDFNKSLSQTSTLLDEIRVKISRLNSTTVRPSVSSGIVPTKEIKAFTEQTERSTKAVKNQGDQMALASIKASTLGKEFTRAFSLIRQAAYVLPGIGIAGIFNLAFEAIAKVLEEFSLLGGAEIRQIEFTNKLNDAYLQLLNTYTKINEENRKFSEMSVGSVGDQEREISLLKAKGESLDIILPKQLAAAKLKADEATANVNKYAGTGSIKYLTDEINRIQSEKTNNAQEISRLQAIIAGGNKVSSSTAKVDKLKSDNALLDLEYNEKNKALENFYNAQKSFGEKRYEYEKYLADQSRKLFVETNRENLSVIIDFNRAQISDDRSTEEERISSIQRIHDAEVSLANINRFNVINNNSSSIKEKEIANNKYEDDTKKAAIKLSQETEKTQIEFYQRLIKAKTDISKDEIDKDAISQEKIFNNEEKSLEKRLAAYSKYIILKQQIEELEYQRDKQRGAQKEGGKTNLTYDESVGLFSDKITLKTNIQADSEKKIYDIVTTSLNKQLKEVTDINDKEIDSNKVAYTLELRMLNDKFEAQKVSVRDFLEEKRNIEHKYKLEDLDNQIKDDNLDIVRLVDHLESLDKAKYDALDKKNTAGALLDNKKRKGGSTLKEQNSYDKAVGELNAVNDAILNGEKKLSAATQSLRNDELKKEEERYAKLSELEKKHLKERLLYLEIFKNIEKELYQFAKEMGDRTYEDKIKKVELNRQTVDEQYGYEIDAIQKSSLSAKEKNALDIQLAEQKIEADKAAALEEKRLRHEKAVFDKKLSLVHIVLSTAESVAEALTAGIGTGEALAIERAAAGAAELALAAATEVPSYAEGTPEGGHKGGRARYGEAGWEIVKKPYQSPYLVTKETVSYLPEGTDIIPVKNMPIFGESVNNNSDWEQTLYLARQFRKAKAEINNVFRPVINIDGNFINYKRNILGN